MSEPLTNPVGDNQLNNPLNVSDQSAQSALPSDTPTPDIAKPPTESKPIDDSPKTDPIENEDYETYVTRQAKNVAAIEEESPTIRIFYELVSKNAEDNPGTNEVLEPKYREALISSGFSMEHITEIIKGMENDKTIERVCTELDGVSCDILRVIE